MRQQMTESKSQRNNGIEANVLLPSLERECVALVPVQGLSSKVHTRFWQGENGQDVQVQVAVRLKSKVDRSSACSRQEHPTIQFKSQIIMCNEVWDVGEGSRRDFNFSHAISWSIRGGGQPECE